MYFPDVIYLEIYTKTEQSQPPKCKVSTKSLHEKYKTLKEIQNGLSKKGAASKYNVALNTISREDHQCCHKGKKTQDEEPKGRKLWQIGSGSGQVFS